MTDVIPSNLSNLLNAADEYLDFLESEDYIEDELGDYQHAIFEAAMEAIYGEKIWDIINERMK